ncbi:MAG: LacI family DNA-binding transcriptional regulator, partial [Candidatus Humimicrobiaceae bacterium]
LQSILEQKIDAVIITPVLSDTTAVEKLKACNIPFILLARNYKDCKANFVGIDFKYSMKKVVDHFVKYGRKRILSICGTEITHSSKMRLSGYKNALKAHNIEFDLELVIENIKNEEYLWHQLDNLIKVKKKIDAIYCYDFNTTSSVLKYCKTSNVKIPEEIALIGFEFEKFCANAYVPLTAIKYDTDKISEMVWSILENLINLNNFPKTIKTISTQSEIIIRESCGES